MLASIDSIAFVHSYRQIPSSAELTERGDFVEKKGKKIDSLKWISNGLRETNEPRLTIYETWNKIFRLRVDLSVPNLLFGANIQLPNESEIQKALEIVSNNVKQRTGIEFDSFSAEMCRVDYALNLKFNAEQVKSVIARYRHFDVPRLLRSTVGNETVYFRNKSRTIRIYDKFAEVAAKKTNPELRAQSNGLVRAEYSFMNAESIRSLMKRLRFQNTSAGEILSQKCISAAHYELRELLKLDSINFSQDSKINIAFQQTQDIKTAMRLSSFVEAVYCFGEDFHRDDSFNMSKSTYDRNLRDCQTLGLL